MHDYDNVSFWLETANDDLTPRPSLDGPLDVDVAVLGAGYSGLWTAYYLLRRDPSLRLAVLEREVSGFGASGRNGAWCSSKLSVSNKELVKRYNGLMAKRTTKAMRDAVDEVGRVASEEGIDAQYRKGGYLQIARGKHELPVVQDSWESLASLDLTDGCTVLSSEELSERVRVQGAEAALFDPHCATIHPGRLVRGLARAVERRGGTIYEQSAVEDFEPGPRPSLKTAHGSVRADVVVLAGEAYLSQLEKLHRQVMPIYSLIVLTEPLSDEQWDSVGWEGHECLSSSRLTVDYLSRTTDGRILFGGRGAPYHLGSKIADEYDRHEATHRMLKESLLDWFPSLRGVKFTHEWGGPLGTKRDWMPTAAFDPRTGVACAYGYTGQGVSTSNLCGRILAEQIANERSELSQLPMAGHRSRDWEPEPLRWLAVRYIQQSMARTDARGQRTGQHATGKSLAERISRH